MVNGFSATAGADSNWLVAARPTRRQPDVTRLLQLRWHSGRGDYSLAELATISEATPSTRHTPSTAENAVAELVLRPT